MFIHKAVFSCSLSENGTYYGIMKMQTACKPRFTKEILFSFRYSAYVIISKSEFLCIIYPIEKKQLNVIY